MPEIIFYVQCCFTCVSISGHTGGQVVTPRSVVTGGSKLPCVGVRN